MLEEWKERVFRENCNLVRYGLVVLTWGNVSAIDRESGLVVIKPSGVPYETMRAEDMVVVDLDGKVVEGKLSPSSDTPAHLFLYQNFPQAGGIVHTHSVYATAWAQAGRPIPAYGTTHADAFFGAVPCTRGLTRAEVAGEYEKNTARVIVETFSDLDESAVPAVLVHRHGPFSWGATPERAVENAVILEAVAKMAVHTEMINAGATPAEDHLLRRHYERKHGANAYYGQK